MPRKRRTPKPRATQAPGGIVAYLLTGDRNGEDVLNHVAVGFEFDNRPNRLLLFELTSSRSPKLIKWWTALRKPLLDGWIVAFPGTRPWGWWRFDAPRWCRVDLPERCRLFGDWLLKETAVPRRRLGGTGDPVHEHLNYKPSFAFGVPTSFVEPWSVEHYNGRAKDIHGNPVGEEYDEGHFTGKAIDPSDPPVYEARASYLLRHALFIDGERERLPADAFDPETVTR